MSFEIKGFDTREEMLSHQRDVNLKLIRELYAELAKAREVIAFYADPFNYSLTSHQRPRMELERRIMSRSDCGEHPDSIYPVAGRAAREYLGDKK